MRIGPSTSLLRAPLATVTAPAAGQPSLPTGVLERGMKGEAVRQLQQALVRTGHLQAADAESGPGSFGPRTEAAVRAFQHAAGIRVDGVYGSATRAALQKALTPAPTPKPTPAPAPTPSPTTGLSQEANAVFTLAQLWPYLQRYGQQHGADPKLLAAMVAQESTFTNWKVHGDGSGHGLIGLDDNGMLPDFEKWSGLRVGRGRNAKVIPPELQLEYLAVRLGELTRTYGSSLAAARAWHRGPGPRMWDAKGSAYANLIQGHMRRLFS